MYSNKENVNILTTLMVEHGIKRVVVCPGSRNSPLVHNFNECPAIECFPVTDERSAAFYALGMTEVTGSPVAVCVTSGSALLNTIPAVAEAAYQKQSILVISADRPGEWIGQMDGQTLPQTDVFSSFVKKEVSLPEPHNENTHWLCNRLVNEALMALTDGPVHINIPISEPIFTYDVPSLPKERTINKVKWSLDHISSFGRIMVILGQCPRFAIPAELHRKVALLSEPISSSEISYTDAMLCRSGASALNPEIVLYIGGNTVSKRLRQYLRSLDAIQMVCSDEFHDVSQNTSLFVSANPERIFDDLCLLPDSPYAIAWQRYREETVERHAAFEPAYSGLLAVKLLEESLAPTDTVFYGNSMAIRYAEIYARGYRHCNRGLNGIDGSVSAAAGASLASDNRVFLVTGDLSFFYDSNALWQNSLRGNFRIMVINNGGGAIFGTLPGNSAALPYISGIHNTSVEGTAKQFGARYLKATDTASLEAGIRTLIAHDSNTPAILEVMTDSKADAEELNKYYTSQNTF